MATKKTKRYDDGGMTSSDDSESAAKQRGLLESSKDAPVGFFERLRMGNIDDPNSEAYRRFGAGRGRAASVPVEDRTPTPVKSDVDAANASDDPIASMNKSRGWTASDDSGASKSAESESAPYKISAPQAPSKPEPKKDSGKASSDSRSYTDESKRGAAAENIRNRPYTQESERGAAREATRAETRKRIAAGDQAIEPVYPESNLVPMPGLGALNIAAKSLANAGKTGRALTTAAETPVKFLGRSGERVVNAPRLAGKTAEAATEAAPAARIAQSAAPKAPSAQKQLSAPKDKSDNVKEAARKMSERDQKAKGRQTRDIVSAREAWARGPSGMKRGGMVKFANGGVVGRRGDGIAQRGKTKGVMR